jgi:predicted nucleotidyltransferase
MTSTSLNIAGKIDPRTVATIAAVAQVITELGMPWVIIGATARDLVLHHGHGANIQRATQDVDFAIEVPDWSAFEAVKERLCAQGLHATKASHRLVDSAGGVIDIVPFGHIRDEQATIAWPPTSEIEMNVLGFQEACDHAQWVRLREEPALDVPVATPAGLTLLKLIAWTDRSVDLRRKDALDLGYLLSTYEQIPDIRDALYEDENTGIMEGYDWDLSLAAAHLLGRHTRAIARSDTQQRIAHLADGELEPLTLDRLAEEMYEHIDSHYERNRRLLAAFMTGFSE